MDSRFSNQRVYLLYVATALYVFVDLLPVVPVVVVTLQWPEQIWVALVPYLAVTLGGLAGIPIARLQHATHNDDSRDGIGDAHQRGVQGCRHIPDNLPTHKTGEHKHREFLDKLAHALVVSKIYGPHSEDHGDDHGKL